MRIERIEKQDIYIKVLESIMNLVYASNHGDRLPSERELSERLGVARSTIREAIRSLAFMGVLDVKQGGGVFVNTLDDSSFAKMLEMGLLLRKSTVAELIEARRFVESQVAALAAERHTSEDRAKLAAIMSRMAASQGDTKRASELDLLFHLELANACHNTVMNYILKTLGALLREWIDQAFSNRELVITDIIAEHNAVMESVFARDSKKARELMEEHIESASERLFKVAGRDSVLQVRHFGMVEKTSRISISVKEE